MAQCSWKEDVRGKLPIFSFLQLQLNNFSIHVLKGIHVKNLSVSSSPPSRDSSCPSADQRDNSSPKAAIQVSQGCLRFISADTPKPGHGCSHKQESLPLPALLISMYGRSSATLRKILLARKSWVSEKIMPHALSHTLFLLPVLTKGIAKMWNKRIFLLCFFFPWD